MVSKLSEILHREPGDQMIITNGGTTKNYEIDFDNNHKRLSLKINRADVADFMLSQITDDRFTKKTVSISN